jgi:hypothetical protein
LESERGERGKAPELDGAEGEEEGGNEIDEEGLLAKELADGANRE